MRGLDSSTAQPSHCLMHTCIVSYSPNLQKVASTFTLPSLATTAKEEGSVRERGGGSASLVMWPSCDPEGGGLWTIWWNMLDTRSSSELRWPETSGKSTVWSAYCGCLCVCMNIGDRECVCIRNKSNDFAPCSWQRSSCVSFAWQISHPPCNIHKEDFKYLTPHNQKQVLHQTTCQVLISLHVARSSLVELARQLVRQSWWDRAGETELARQSWWDRAGETELVRQS